MDISGWFSKRTQSERDGRLNKAMSINVDFILELEQQNHPVIDDLRELLWCTSVTDRIVEFQSKISSTSKNESDLYGPIRAMQGLETVYDYFNRLRDIDLCKKVDEKLWSQFKVHHDEINKQTVDPSMHIQMSKPHIEHMDALKSPKTMEPHKLFHSGYSETVSPSEAGSGEHTTGITPKLVHNVGKGTYMMKPYHTDIDPGTETYTRHPITGWATMAFKGLCNAGGIGHLCEDVHTSEHDNVPVNVHKFAKGFHEYSSVVDNNQPGYVNPLHHSQIAVMDYLTNNLDRHGGNIMMSGTPNKDKNQTHDLLAIDNERAFQYHTHPKTKAQGPSDTGTMVSMEDIMGGGSLGRMKLRLPINEDASKETAQWWNQNKDNLKSELNKHLEFIKDEGIREHIRTNFNDRWNSLDDALGTHPDGYGDWKMDVSAPITKYEPPVPESIKKFTKRVENMKPEAVLEAIADITNKHGVHLPNDYRRGLSEIAYGATKRLGPEGSVEMYNRLHTDPKFARESVHQYMYPYGILSNSFGKYDDLGRLHEHPDAAKTRQLFKQYYEKLPDSSFIKDKLRSWYEQESEKGW